MFPKNAAVDDIVGSGFHRIDFNKWIFSLSKGISGGAARNCDFFAACFFPVRLIYPARENPD